jgi:IS30 family transposase
MKRQAKPWLTSTQKGEIWKRWRAAESVSEISRALEREVGSVHRMLAKRGGIAPPPRKRSPRALTPEEREAISRGLSANWSSNRIAASLNRAPSTISREIERNGGPIKYRAQQADANAWKSALRPKACALSNRARLRMLVASKLKQQWAPAQISGWLKRQFPVNKLMQLSHETIYRSLYVQARGVLKKELMEHLRTHRVMRRAKKATGSGQNRGAIIDAVSISERPAEVEDRAVPGHWEGDLISGSNNSHIATLVERQSRFVMLVKVQGKDTTSVVSALIKQVKKLPKELRQTLTWDRGRELASHKTFTLATEVDVYFCDPRSPWQRGSNENTNGLLRQYFPKGTRLDGYSQAELNKVAALLNGRPRKTLDFMTPADKLAEVIGVATTS